MNYSAGNKVFETEQEAKKFAKDLNRRGIMCIAHETDKDVTHRYIGPDGLTKEVLNMNIDTSKVGV